VMMFGNFCASLQKFSMIIQRKSHKNVAYSKQKLNPDTKSGH